MLVVNNVRVYTHLTIDKELWDTLEVEFRVYDAGSKLSQSSSMTIT